MMEVLIAKKSKTWDITEMVEYVDWFGKKNRSARTVNIQFVNLPDSVHDSIKMNEGEGIFFKWDNVELFRGVIFKVGSSKNGKFSLTAHDNMIYLLKNDDSRVFRNRTATQITRTICKDFGIPYGSLIDTRYVIPTKVFDGINLYDMILKSLNDTHKNTNERFYIYSQKGKIQLIRREEQTRIWVIESGVNLIDYDYQSSIEDTATRVKVEAGTDKKTVIATADNNKLQKELGILQYYDRTTEELNKAQARSRADTILGRRARRVVNYSVDALGVPDVISGKMVRIIEDEMEIDRNYYVDYDNHTFSGQDHFMSIELTTTW